MASYESHHPLTSPSHHDPPRDQFFPLPVSSSPHQPYPSPPLHDTEPTSPLSPGAYGHGAAYPAYGEPRVGGKMERQTEDPAPLERREVRRSRWRAFWATYKTRNQVRSLLIFLGVIGFEAVGVLAMIALTYGTIRNATGDVGTLETLNDDPQLTSVATYLSLFILAVVFEIGITLDALQQKNIMTLVVLCAFQVAMLVYSAVLPSQLSTALDGSNADTPLVRRLTHIYTIIIPCVVGAATVVMTGMLYPLRAEFGWDTFKRIGADIRIRDAFVRYQRFVCLVKFDGFFFVGFAMQFLVLVSGTPTVEFVLTIVALPVIIVALALFAIVVRIESRTGVYCSFVVQAAGMAYFVYKIVRIYSTSNSDRYDAAKATLTIFSIISLLMLLVTTILMGLCMLNFGMGLRERIPGYAFNGGKPLFSSRPSADRLPSSRSNRLQQQQQPHPYSSPSGAGVGFGINALNAYTDSSGVYDANPSFETVFEMGHRIEGAKIGIVTTAYLADATLALVCAHTAKRSEYDLILSQFLEGVTGRPWSQWNGPDVILGFGGRYFEAHHVRNSSRGTSVEDEATGAAVANIEDAPQGFFISGSLPTADDRVFAWGPGHELFRGIQNSVDTGKENEIALIPPPECAGSLRNAR
ncbi:hypothetical protein JCM8547_006277 [Rhodosporidiobolus lusitaniae]